MGQEGRNRNLTGYKVLINSKVIIARHCDIIEEDITLCGFEDEKDEQTDVEEEEKRNCRTLGR